MSTENSAHLSVVNPAIPEILDLRSGRLIPTPEAIGSDWVSALQLRMGLSEGIASGSPLYVCPLCLTPVYLVSQKERGRFFFRHKIEDGGCPSITRGELSENEINALKYNGIKESEAHKNLKRIVAESLRSDKRFTEIRVEEVVRGADRSQWRKPDVQALYEGKPIVFEIQLSTTFLRVIAERRIFYRNIGTALIWVFNHFDPEQARLPQEDIIYSNNRNIFLVNERTLQISKEAGKFHMNCQWAEPTSDADKWMFSLVSFDHLTLDFDRQRVFFFDYELALSSKNQVDQDAMLRQRFEKFWLSRTSLDPFNKDEWSQLTADFLERGLKLPVEPNQGGGPWVLLNTLYSAREGQVIGWRLKKMIEVGHLLEGSYKQYLLHFGKALHTYGRVDQIRKEDKQGKWGRKMERMRQGYARREPDYAPDMKFEALIKFLFPEIFSKDQTTLHSQRVSDHR